MQAYRTSKSRQPQCLRFLALAASLSLSCKAGILEGQIDLATALNRNLSQEGNLDWAVWGFAEGGRSISLVPDVQKSTGAGLSDLENLTNGNPLRGLGQFGAFGHTFRWSDGSPTVSAQNATTGVQHDGQQFPQALTVGEGFSLSVPADMVPRTLTLYVTTHLGVGQLNARLSDGSAAPYSELLDAFGLNNAAGIFTLRYAANSGDQHLQIEFILTSANNPINSSNVAIQAASLAADSDLPLSLSITSAVYPHLTIHGSPGSTNRVEFTDAVKLPSWDTLTNVVLLGTVSAMISDPTVSGIFHRYYRAVRVE